MMRKAFPLVDEMEIDDIDSVIDAEERDGNLDKDENGDDAGE